MSQEKSSLSYFLTPAGAIIAAVAFFLPWVKLSCSGQVFNMNGFQLAKNDALMWVVFAAAILIGIGFFFLRNKWDLGKIKKLSFVASLAGIGILLYKYFDFKSSMDSMGQFMGGAGGGNWEQSLQQSGVQDFQITLQLGAYACLIGFILAGLGALFLNKEEEFQPRVVTDRSANSVRQTSQAYSRNVRNSSPSATPKPASECQFCVNGLPPGFISCPECGATKPAVMS
jgi:hypothetical protein